MGRKKNKKQLLIFGTGEYGELAQYYFTHDSNYDVAAFVADDEFVKDNVFNGLPLVPFSELPDKYTPDDYDAHVALSYMKLCKTRADKYLAMKKKGYTLASYVCSRSVTWPDLTIGDNCFILENQTIQPTVKIGSNVLIWSGNHLGHRCVIKDHTYISSHVCISGYAEIGSNCFLGVNSAVKDFVKIGNEVFVTMGALVTRDVKDGSVVVGVRGETFPNNSEIARRLRGKYLKI